MSNFIAASPLTTLKVSSEFTDKRAKSNTSKEFQAHEGMDLQAQLNTDVHAANGGEVIYAGWAKGYGKVVVVQEYTTDSHNIKTYGQATMYAHLNIINVTKGAPVTAGNVIAQSGASGGDDPNAPDAMHKFKAHLHFEVWDEASATITRESGKFNYNATRENPREYLTSLKNGAGEDMLSVTVDASIRVYNITGDHRDNILEGNARNNTLNGGGGNDTLKEFYDKVERTSFLGTLSPSPCQGATPPLESPVRLQLVACAPQTGRAKDNRILCPAGGLVHLPQNMVFLSSGSMAA